MIWGFRAFDHGPASLEPNGCTCCKRQTATQDGSVEAQKAAGKEFWWGKGPGRGEKQRALRALEKQQDEKAKYEKAKAEALGKKDPVKRKFAWDFDAVAVGEIYMRV